MKNEEFAPKIQDIRMVADNTLQNMQPRNCFKWISLILLCICFSAGTMAQQNSINSNLLYWAKNRQLTTKDFGAARNAGDTIFIHLNKGAGVHRLGVILTAIDVQVKTTRGQTTFTIRAVMDKNRSWIRNEGDTISLKHEQGHFDICEIYARVMRREIRKASSLAHSKAIYEEVLAAESVEHAAFDRENTFEQGGITKVWQAKIAHRLRELEVFSNPAVTITVDR